MSWLLEVGRSCAEGHVVDWYIHASQGAAGFVLVRLREERFNLGQRSFTDIGSNLIIGHADSNAIQRYERP